MATPMEYDVLREFYSDTMAMFSRLAHKHNIPKEDYKEDKEEFSAIWLNEVRSLELEQIDYDKILAKLQAISKPWRNIENQFFRIKSLSTFLMDKNANFDCYKPIKNSKSGRLIQKRLYELQTLAVSDADYKKDKILKELRIILKSRHNLKNHFLQKKKI